MCESRAVPSGKVYRQVFDAQVGFKPDTLKLIHYTYTEMEVSVFLDHICEKFNKALSPEGQIHFFISTTLDQV